MQNYQEDNSVDNMSLSKQIKLYTKEWKWFLLSIFCILGLAYTYLRYAKPQYDSLTTILIKDPSEGRGLSELAAFSDLGAFSDMGSNDVNDEVEILKSKTLIGLVISDLNVNISQYAIGNIKNSSIYGISPVDVVYDWNNDIERPNKSFEITLGFENEYELLDLITEKKYTGIFGKTLFIDEGELVVNKSQSFNDNAIKADNRLERILVNVTSISKFTEYLQRTINVAPKSKGVVLLIYLCVQLINVCLKIF